MTFSKKAFTLIELLVVIAIIGLLASISIISLNNARAKARDTKRVADIKQVTTALELFFNDAGRYPTDQEWASGSLSYNNQTYLSTIPSAPNPPDGTCDSGTNQFSYTQDNNGESYTITFCTGGNINSLSAGNLCATPGGLAACGGGNGGGFTCGDSVSYGGESYPTIQIGTQCWFAKNLNVGTMITGVTSQTDNSTLEKYCYNDDASSECATYGGLYQWNEAMQYSVTEGAQGICPSGWHIPTDTEQDTLDQYLTDSPNTCDSGRSSSWDCDAAGTKMQSGGSSGFDGLMAGYRFVDGSFNNQGVLVYFWSSSNIWERVLQASTPTVGRFADPQSFGFSVRCLQD